MFALKEVEVAQLTARVEQAHLGNFSRAVNPQDL
jgi:hypothetical protein